MIRTFCNRVVLQLRKLVKNLTHNFTLSFVRFQDLGTPNEKIWPGFKQLPAVQKTKFTEYPVSNLRSRFGMLSELGILMLNKFLTYDPQQRVTAEDAMKHPYFDEVPLPIDPAMFPTWPAKSELGHRRALAASPKPPSGGREYKQLVSTVLQFCSHF